MRGLWNAVKWETILSVKENISYKTSFYTDMMIFVGAFIAIYYMGVSSVFSSFYQVNREMGQILVLIGYIFWQNASAALGASSSIIHGELSRGSFEIRMQSVYRVPAIVFAKTVVTILIDCFSYLFIMLFCAVTMGFKVENIYIVMISVLLSFPSILGMYGIGLILGGISVKQKKLGSVVMILQTGMLIVSNALSPARNSYVCLIPFSLGIEIVRDVYMGNTVSIISAIAYCVINVFWLVIGEIYFSNALKYERRYGAFDTY
ncbi:MAG: hypothetical protein PUG71_05370 [bacterium]|nr:hypothetical protein [bacterium]